MKNRNWLAIILMTLTFATYGQSNKLEITSESTTVSFFELKTDNLEELKNFNWDIAHNMFRDNDENQEITIAFAYEDSGKQKNSEKEVYNFSFKATAPTSELDDMLETIKILIPKYIEINKSFKN